MLSRVCLNMLQARRSRPEVPLALDAPEPATDADPEQEALLADSIGLALLVVLDALTPAERVAFVLLGVPFEEIAPIVGTQARRRAGSGTPSWSTPASPPPATASSTGCSPSSTPASCSGPTRPRRAWELAARSAESPKSARFRARGATPALLDGAAAAVWIVGGQPRVVYRFTTSDERITGIELIADTDRLRALDLVIGDD